MKSIQKVRVNIKLTFKAQSFGLIKKYYCQTIFKKTSFTINELAGARIIISFFLIFKNYVYL